MRSFFFPAIALMNRLGYTKKFTLLALISILAVGVMAFSLFANIDREIGTSQRELAGLALSAPISRVVQLAQRHRALDTAVIKGVESMRGEHDAVERATDDALDALEAKLPARLKAASAWPEIRKNWALLRSDGLNWTADENFTAQTNLIGQILLLQATIADAYGLILDSDAGSYYLIDIIVNELPHVIEHLGQLRAQGLLILIDRRIAEQQKMRAGAVINEMGDALENLEVNLKKAARYNPALQGSLLGAYRDIADSVEQITGLMESDILTGRFTLTPEKYYAMASVAIDASYRQLHESLLSATETLLKARIAKARNTLYATMGIASLLLLVVTYFAIGIYYSIIGSVRSLARSAHAFSEGDLRQRVHLDTRDELGQIGDSFNKMADGFNAMLAARKHLEESRERLAAILETSPDYISTADPDGHITYINRAGREMLGVGATDEINFQIANLHPGWAADLILKLGLPAAVANGVWQGETALIGRHGKEIPMLQVILAHKMASGKVEYLSTVMRDISSIKQREKELHRSNAVLQELNSELEKMHNELRGSRDDLHRLLDSMAEGVYGVDTDGNCTFVNRSLLQTLGYQNDNEVLGKNMHELIHHSHSDGSPYTVSECKIYRAFQDNQTTNVADEVFWRKDDTAIPVEYWSHPVTADGVVTGSIVTFVDITERKQAEERLRKYNEELEAINHQLQDTQNLLLQAEKMSSIGQLAAGVAHEINNPIGYVYSNLGTLEKYVQDAFNMIEQYEQTEGAIADDAVRARLKAAREKLDIGFLKEDLRALMDESKDGITRVKQIVQNLKDFSHVDASDEWHFADLRSGLESTLNIVNNEIKYKADVVREYDDLPEVECLSSQLNQVFMNLLVNAAHAIEERGTITVRTGRQGEEVWVEIADTGKGIAPEHLKKIFDPFFTTKPVGKGTGLGLSLSYGIIQKHHGRIEVQSEPGKGTAFRVWLPMKQTEETQQP